MNLTNEFKFDMSLFVFRFGPWSFAHASRPAMHPGRRRWESPCASETSIRGHGTAESNDSGHFDISWALRFEILECPNYAISLLYTHILILVYM